MYIEKNNLDNDENIFSIIEKIDIEYKDSGYLLLQFDKSVTYIPPFFLILILQNCHKTHRKLVFDFFDARIDIQGYLVRYLRQFFDFKKIKIKNDSLKQYSIAERKDIFQKLNFRDDLETIIYLYGFSAKHFPQTDFCKYETNKKEYNTLPIISLTNYTRDFIYNNSRSYVEDIESECKEFYELISVDSSKNTYAPIKKIVSNIKKPIYRIKSKISQEKFNNNLEQLNKELTHIFYEIIDNIKTHTKYDNETYSNAYISSRQTNEFRYDFIISDDYEVGFIESYRKTLEGNNDLLPSSLQNEKTIDLVSNMGDMCILAALFGFDNVLKEKQCDEDITFVFRDIQRLTMHFGIHILKKVILNLKGKFEYFVHHDNSFYHVEYNCFTGTPVANIEKIDSGRIGTHVLVSFAQAGLLDFLEQHEDNVELIGKTELTLKNHQYENIFKNKSSMINNQDFQHLSLEHLKDYDKLANINKPVYIEYPTSPSSDMGIARFIRYLYAFSFFNNTRDFFVYNVPLDDTKEYLLLIIDFLYKNVKDKSTKIEIPNIIFQNKSSFEIFFIGGDDLETCRKINDNISKSYNSSLHDDTNNIPRIVESKLFLPHENGYILYPFELFLKDANIVEKSIQNYLEKHAQENIHLDTHVGTHINKFYDFRSIFENSRWVKRLAFKLAEELDTLSLGTMFLIGTDKYTNMLISLAVKYIDGYKFKKISGYDIYNIYEKKDFERLLQTIEKSAQENHMVFISSVGYKREKIKELTRPFKHNKFTAITAIQLLMNGKQSQANNAIVTFNANLSEGKNKFTITDDSYCTKCATRRVPLLELDRDDPFIIRDTYFGLSDCKENTLPYPLASDSVNWSQCFTFGHTERGTNHFLYYVDTITFFDKNKDKIRDFLDYTKERIFKNELNANNQFLILAPSHNTHNNFISLVNDIVFDNEATVLYFDKNKGEDNFHRLQKYAYAWDKTKVFFIDDSMASGYTLEYFYTILKKMPKYDALGFDGVIMLIDRMLDADRIVTSNYLKPLNHEINDDINSDGIVVETSENIFAFTKYQVNPIKTEVKACFLCDRVEEYLDLMTKSVLDLTILKMADKALKIRKTDYCQLSIQDEKIESRAKTFVKALAADYIHKEFTCHQNDKKSVRNLLEGFIAYIKILMYKQMDKFIDNVGHEFIDEFIKFEAEVALIKAMSFPKISYYYDVRKEVLGYIVDNIKTDFLNVKTNDNKILFNVERIITSPAKETSVHKSFIKIYKNKTNLHKLNAYFSVLGYFKDPILLSQEYIELYYEATLKKDNFETNDVFHTYPFAVKMTVSDNIEKSRFFEVNLQKVKQTYKRGDYRFGDGTWALFDALYLENTLFDRNTFIDDRKIKKVNDCFKGFKSKNKLSDKMESLQRELTKFIGVNSGISLYIYPHLHKKYSSYKEYLDIAENKMVNLFGNLSSVENIEDTELKNNVKTIFYGAVEDNIILEQDGIMKLKKFEANQDIADTWANMYYSGNTIVRLVKVDRTRLFEESNNRNNYRKNDNLWFKPIGCLVVPHDDKKNHLEIVRKILSIRYELVNFIYDELSRGIIHSALEVKIYQQALADVNHSVKRYINIRQRTTNVLLNYDRVDKADFNYHMKEDGFVSELDYFIYLYREINEYAFALNNISSIRDILSTQAGFIETDIKNVLNDKYIQSFIKFLKVADKIGMQSVIDSQKDYVIDIRDLRTKSLILQLDENQASIFIFELLFNAVKATKNIKGKSVKIKMCSLENSTGIYLLNSVNEEEKKELSENRPYISDSISGVGTKTIQEMLKRNQFTINLIIDLDGEDFPKIYKSEYNVCIKIEKRIE